MYKANNILTYLILGIIFLLPGLPADAKEPMANFQMIRLDPGLSLHKEMYMLPVTISDKYDGAQTEAVFQISAKHRVFRTRFYFAYTQISFWQAYDSKRSAPFRETNYNPEIFYRTKRFSFLNGGIGADIGFEHESNGQRVPLSRSWNLLYFAPYYYNDNFLLYLKLRYRIPEDEKESPGNAIGDDNPDITDYLGYSLMHIQFKFAADHLLHLKLQGNIGQGNGGIALSYSLPVPLGEESYFVFRFSRGYGESLVDYKEYLDRVGIGVMFRH